MSDKGQDTSKPRPGKPLPSDPLEYLLNRRQTRPRSPSADANSTAQPSGVSPFDRGPPLKSRKTIIPPRDSNAGPRSSSVSETVPRPMASSRIIKLHTKSGLTAQFHKSLRPGFTPSDKASSVGSTSGPFPAVTETPRNTVTRHKSPANVLVRRPPRHDMKDTVAVAHNRAPSASHENSQNPGSFTASTTISLTQVTTPSASQSHVEPSSPSSQPLLESSVGLPHTDAAVPLGTGFVITSSSSEGEVESNPDDSVRTAIVDPDASTSDHPAGSTDSDIAHSHPFSDETPLPCAAYRGIVMVPWLKSNRIISVQVDSGTIRAREPAVERIIIYQFPTSFIRAVFAQARKPSGNTDPYYVVIAGLQLGVMSTWTEAQRHVQGVSNAYYLRCKTWAAVEQYVVSGHGHERYEKAILENFRWKPQAK